MAMTSRKVELAPPMGQPAMPQGIVSIICSWDTEHLHGKSDAQIAAEDGKTDRYFSGYSVGVHAAHHHSWVMMRRLHGSSRHVHDEYTTGSGGAAAPSAIVISDFNGMDLKTAQDPDEVKVLGVCQNDNPTEPDRNGAITDDVVTVAIRGILTVQCFTREHLRVGDWFGVKAPDLPEYMENWPRSDRQSWVLKGAFPGQHADKVIPVMFRIGYGQIQEALTKLMTRDVGKYDPAYIAVPKDVKEDTWGGAGVKNIHLAIGNAAAGPKYGEGGKDVKHNKGDFVVKDGEFNYHQGKLQERIHDASKRLSAENIPELKIADNLVWLFGRTIHDSNGDAPISTVPDSVVLARVLAVAATEVRILSNRAELGNLVEKFQKTPAAVGELTRSTAGVPFGFLAAGVTMMTAFAARVNQQMKGQMTTDAPIGVSWPTVMLQA